MATITHITDKDSPLFASGDQFVSGQKIFLIQPNKAFWVDSENLDSAHGWLYIDQSSTAIGYHNHGVVIDDSQVQMIGLTNFDDIAQFIGNGKILFVGNEDYGTQLDGNKSGIKLNTFQNPTDITIRTDFVGGNYDDIISIHHSYYTAQLFGESINAATELGDQIVIYQTGSLYGIPNSKGPYLRLGTHNIISEKSDSKLGIGTLFPQEKVHISGGNLRVEGDVLANNLYTKDNPSGFITGIDLSNYATVSNLQLTGKNLNDKINSLSGVAVLIYGDQIINGTKRFNENVYIKNLFVTGTETIVSTTNFNVQSPYLILNLTGGAVDGGIFFVTGSGLTGINDYGPIIGFDHSKNFKFGVARRSDDLSTLNDIAAIQDITNYSGFVDNKYYPRSNPSGYVTKSNGQFDDRPTVNGTGILLSGEAAQLPDTIVYNSGDQTISGVKNFQNDVQLNTINGNTSFGIYKYNLSIKCQDQYLKQEQELSNFANTVSGIKNANIVNFYFSDGNINPDGRKRTLKVNPGILVDHNGDSPNRNLIKFPDESIYSGKAIRKVRYNSTIGNGYERINLTNLSFETNPATIRPLTRRLETFYDISVPSGGGVRALYFNMPTSQNFVQGLYMNLRFNFEADSSPCVISGYSAYGLIFLLTGANYNFVQKERVILINKGTAPYYEFIHW